MDFMLTMLTIFILGKKLIKCLAILSPMILRRELAKNRKNWRIIFLPLILLQPMMKLQLPVFVITEKNLYICQPEKQFQNPNPQKSFFIKPGKENLFPST